MRIRKRPKNDSWVLARIAGDFHIRKNHNTMRKIFAFVGIAFLFALLTGCSTAKYNTSNHLNTETQIVLSEANYKIIKQVTGYAETTRVFGIGGLSRRACEANAYADMVANANLQGSQAIINVSFDDKGKGFLPIVWIRTVTAKGYVIEFTK